MAQNPNAMQEPSMDELLASIREIIEENTGPSPNRIPNRQDANAHEPAVPTQRNFAGESQARVSPNSITSPVMSPSSRGDERLAVQQYGDVGQINSETPPVQDAMNALAARIGLRHNEDSDGLMHEGVPRDDRSHLPPPPAAMVVKTNPSERAQQNQSAPQPISQARAANSTSNNGNVNIAPAHSNNVQNTGNTPMHAGQLRPQNPSDQTSQFQGQPLQQRNAPVQAPSQAVPQQHTAQQAQMELARQREMQQVRQVPQQREVPHQNNGAVRNQPIQGNAAPQQNSNRQMPPQPRVANPSARSNNTAPQTNVRQNVVNERRAPMQQPNFNVEPHIDDRRDMRTNQPPVPHGQKVSNDMNSASHPVPASVNQPNMDAIHEERHLVDRQTLERQGQLGNLAAPQDHVATPDLPQSVPFPRSAPEKPHFLSQALRSAFMSIPAKDSAFQTASSLPQAPLRPQSVSSRSAPQMRVEQKAAEMIEAEVKREIDNIDRALDADFEKSAENLLRPFIAKWLDEHFSELFEKVLREEIKRVIQDQLR